MRLLALSATLLLCSLSACDPTQPAKAAPTPEQIVLHWQFLIDQNQYAEARRISTGNARDFVDYLNSFPHADSAVGALTDLLQLRCLVQGDSALCSFYVEDEVGEKIPDTLLLRKINGEWLVFEVERFKVTPLDSLRPGDEDLIFPPGDSIDQELE